MESRAVFGCRLRVYGFPIFWLIGTKTIYHTSRVMRLSKLLPLKAPVIVGNSHCLPRMLVTYTSVADDEKA